jgi:hypothetical protein
MKKQTLEEQVSRIKGMIKSVNEEWFGKPAPGESMYERFLESYDDEIREAVSKLGRVKYSELEAIPEDKWERVVNDIISTYGEEVLDTIQHWIATGYCDKHELAKFAVQHSDRTGTEKQMVIYAIEDFLRGIGRWDDEEDEEEDIDEGVHTDDEKESHQDLWDISQDRKDSLVMQVALNMLFRGAGSVEDIKTLIMNNNHLSDESKLYILKGAKNN